MLSRRTFAISVAAIVSITSLTAWAEDNDEDFYKPPTVKWVFGSDMTKLYNSDQEACVAGAKTLSGKWTFTKVKPTADEDAKICVFTNSDKDTLDRNIW